MNPDISVIIPAHNEAVNIGNLVSDILLRHPDTEVIVVDDGSIDGTVDAARSAGAIVYRHPYNIGNGAAIKSGVRIASRRILVFMDGGGQHDPGDLTELIQHFPEYDMVVGARPEGEQSSIIHERTSVDHLHTHIHARSYLEADQSVAVREERRRSVCLTKTLISHNAAKLGCDFVFGASEVWFLSQKIREEGNKLLVSVLRGYAEWGD